VAATPARNAVAAPGLERQGNGSPPVQYREGDDQILRLFAFGGDVAVAEHLARLAPEEQDRARSLVANNIRANVHLGLRSAQANNHRPVAPMPYAHPCNLELTKNSSPYIFSYGVMNFATDDRSSAVELGQVLQRLFVEPVARHKTCESCGVVLANQLRLMMHLEKKCAPIPDDISTWVMAGYPVAFYVSAPILRLLEDTVHPDSIGPLDMLDPGAIPYPVGNIVKHRVGMTVDEMIMEAQHCRSLQTRNIWSLWVSKEGLLEKPRNQRAPEYGYLSVVLRLSFLKTKADWPQEAMELYQIEMNRSSRGHGGRR
jgi:hypothetical protein